MSRQINQPINQVRLTNVAVVRMNKGGKRFEIACYRNKVVDYRQGVEQDLSEVLQTDRIFSNVSKGEFAKANDLQKVFGTKDEKEISKLILVKGQLQVSDKERTQQLEKTSAQIAEWISKNCVHPVSDRPYTISQIRHAMQQGNFSVHPTKPLKRQYLDCLKLLQNVIPVHRAKMELAIRVPETSVGEIESTLEDHDIAFQDTAVSVGSTKNYQILVDPSLYRVLNDVIQNIPDGRIEIVNQVVTKQGDVNLEAEVGRTVLGKNKNVMQSDSDIDDVRDDALNQSTFLLGNLSVGSDDDSEVENVVEKEMAMDSVAEVSHGIDDDHDDDDDINDEATEVAMIATRRKAQKNVKKKNKQERRRNVIESDEADTNTTISNQEAGDPTSSDSNMATAAPTKVSGPSSDSADRKSCNTCGGFFDTAAEFRSHFKSDWHRFNQKLKLKGAAPVGEQEFLLCDADTFFASDF